MEHQGKENVYRASELECVLTPVEELLETEEKGVETGSQSKFSYGIT